MKQITLDEATDMAMNTDYACFAVGEKINKADAGAFFLEGYEYANKKNEELTSKACQLEIKYDEQYQELTMLRELVIRYDVECLKLVIDLLSPQKKISNLEEFPCFRELPKDIQKIVREKRKEKYGIE